MNDTRLLDKILIKTTILILHFNLYFMKITIYYYNCYSDEVGHGSFEDFYVFKIK